MVAGAHTGRICNEIRPVPQEVDGPESVGGGMKAPCVPSVGPLYTHTASTYDLHCVSTLLDLHWPGTWHHDYCYWG